jgi:glutamyl-tRNA synthetase
MNNRPAIRVRIAPSPTGYFHMGTARTALFNWLYARHHGGVFIVRIEDTDRERSQTEYENDILDGLTWLGITHDEFYRQSERGDLYSQYLTKLIGNGNAFYCSHSVKELEQEVESQRTAKKPPRHLCADRDKKLQSGIMRFKNNSHEIIHIHDIIRGNIQFDPQLLGDFSIAKSISEPLYNFAVVIDDFEMKISHVIRGEDHISNTPKQILIQDALGFSSPEWAHLPLLLGPDRSKLSKRHGALAVSEYKKQGYLAEAFINFLALLGWHPQAAAIGVAEKEIFSRDELIKEFSLERVQKSAAIAAFDKLGWLNRQYIKSLDLGELWQRAQPFFEESFVSAKEEEVLKKILEASRERIHTLGELQATCESILTPPAYSKELLLWKGKIQEEQVIRIIDNIISILLNIEPSYFSSKTVAEALDALMQKEGKGSVLWPLRAALSGKEASLGPFELADILGKEICIQRLETAKKQLSGAA